eukprot:2913136-Rhodomonas_salina.3
MQRIVLIRTSGIHAVVPVHVFHMFGVRDSDRMVRDRQAAKGKKTELVDLLLAHGARDLHSAGLFLLALPV